MRIKFRYWLLILSLSCTLTVHANPINGIVDFLNEGIGDELDINQTAATILFDGRDLTVELFGINLDLTDIDILSDGQLCKFVNNVCDPRAFDINDFIRVAVDGVIIFDGTADSFNANNAREVAIALGFSFLTSADVATSTTSASGAVNNTVINHITERKIKSRKAQRQEKQRLKKGPSITLLDVKVDFVDFEDIDNDGEIYGLLARADMQLGNYVIGALLPYDHLEFDLFDAERAGIILFAEREFDFSETLYGSAAVNVNYLYTNVDLPDDSGENFSTYGAGISGSLTHDNGGDWVFKLLGSVQFNQDDTNATNDNQWLVKVGPSIGWRIGDNSVITLSALWNEDVTDYSGDLGDDNFYEIEVSGEVFASDTFQIRGGVRHIGGISNFDSNTIFISSEVPIF